MGGRLVRRKATVAVLAAILVGSVATTAGALPAGSFGPSPKLVILQAVFLHNAADKTMLTIALQLQQSYSDCVDQQQQPDPIWSGVEGDGQALQLYVSKDLRPYSKNLSKWVAAIRATKAKGKAGRALQRRAISELEAAIAGHAKEVFNIDAEGNKLLLHDCEGALESLHMAAAAGDPAWIADAGGVIDAKNLLRIKGQKVIGGPPYADAGVH